jgi:hypothetical protein
LTEDEKIRADYEASVSLLTEAERDKLWQDAKAYCWDWMAGKIPRTPANSAKNEHVGPEVILLEGRDIVYLPSHDANRISLGEFWRSMSFADLKDHEMKKYLKRIADKTKGTTEVPYNERQKFMSKHF